MQRTTLLTCALLVLTTRVPAADKPLDFWDEEIRLFGVARQNQHVDAGLAQRLNPGYWYNRATPGFDLDHSDKRVGDLSIRYTPSGSGLAPRFGFVADLWGGHWLLSPSLALRLWVKVDGEKVPTQWKVILVDEAGGTASGVLAGTATGGDWRELTLPLAQLTTASGFNWSAVTLCEFEAAFGKDARVRLDGIRFEGNETFIGVTDKPLAQRMTEARASRAARIEAAFKLSAKDDPSPAVSAFAKMYLNEDLEAANRALVEEIRQSNEKKDYWSQLNDYQLPAVVWRMALDRQGLGSFVYRSRGIGEEENVWPRPAGTERSLTVDTEARLLKYTWVTPDYTLGTQMDHPGAVHSHLSVRGRWHGMTFAQSAAARIVPVAVPEQPTRKGDPGSFDTEVMFRTLQHRNTLIIQQARSWQVVNPDWFPGPDQATYGYARRIAVHVGADWDRREEKGGWIFLQKGAAYAGVRPVLWDEAHEKKQRELGTGAQALFNDAEGIPTVKLRADAYRWNDSRTMLLLEDRFCPVIVEAGSRADYPNLEAFMADVLDNPIALHKTVVPGLHVLVYTGTGRDAREIVFNAADGEIPTVGGEPVNYGHPQTFDSPYLQSPYKSGKIAIAFAGERLELDFADRPPRAARR